MVSVGVGSVGSVVSVGVGSVGSVVSVGVGSVVQWWVVGLSAPCLPLLKHWSFPAMARQFTPPLAGRGCFRP